MNTEKNIILVVEDEQPLLLAIKTKLEKSGFGVVTARSVESALRRLADTPDIRAIWLDHYLLGKENGLGLVKSCRNDGAKLKHIPIFVVSNTASDAMVRSYFALGIQKYFVKAEKRIEAIIEEIRAQLRPAQVQSH